MVAEEALVAVAATAADTEFGLIGRDHHDGIWRMINRRCCGVISHIIGKKKVYLE
jgi:hypothetical protein